MQKWRCSQCGYYYEGQVPPDKCPGCQSACSFVDANCYIPECGGGSGKA